MRYRSLLLGIAWGALIGSVGAAIVWVHALHSNAYLEYGLLRLSYQTLVAVWNSVWFGAVLIAAGIWSLAALLIRLAGWSERRATRLAIVTATALTVVLAVDWILRMETGFTLSHASSRIAAKVAGLASGTLGIDQLKKTFTANRKGAVLLIVGAALAVAVFWLIMRIAWEKVVLWVEDRARHFLRLGLILALLTLALNAISTYDSWRNPPSGPSILIVVVDCMRPDHLGSYGHRRNTSPNIDRLAQRGVTCLQAYSNAPWTKPSIGTMFTSLYPDAHTAMGYVDLLPARVLTLAEILKNEGYATIFLNSENPFITGRFGFHQGFDITEDSGTHRDAAQLSERFLSVLDDLGDKRYFAYLHFMDVHVPYSENEFNEEFTSQSSSRFRPDGVKTRLVRRLTVEGGLTDSDKQHILGLYDGQLKYVDHHLGKILDRLDSKSKRDRPLVVLIADHGEEFWEHGNFEHGHTLYQELIRVPMILAGHGLPSKTVERQVSLIDLVPTLLELAGIDRAELGLQGVSFASVLGDRPAEDDETPLYATGTLYGSEKRCVIKEGSKLIVNTGDIAWKLELAGRSRTSVVELYNLRTDPGEQTDLAGPENRTAVELLKLIKDFENLDEIYKGKRTILDGELKRRMRSVGYL